MEIKGCKKYYIDWIWQQRHWSQLGQFQTRYSLLMCSTTAQMKLYIFDLVLGRAWEFALCMCELTGQSVATWQMLFHILMRADTEHGDFWLPVSLHLTLLWSHHLIVSQCLHWCELRYRVVKFVTLACASVRSLPQLDLNYGEVQPVAYSGWRLSHAVWKKLVAGSQGALSENELKTLHFLKHHHV